MTNLETIPAFSTGERVITAFGEPGSVAGETPYPNIYCIEVDGPGETINRLRMLTVDMFERQPTV